MAANPINTIIGKSKKEGVRIKLVFPKLKLILYIEVETKKTVTTNSREFNLFIVHLIK